MSKEQILDMIRLLAAMESAMLATKVTIPDHVHSQLAKSLDALYEQAMK